MLYIIHKAPQKTQNTPVMVHLITKTYMLLYDVVYELLAQQ